MSRILFVKSTPYDEDPNGYNVQGIGIAKAFCRLGYDCDYLNYQRHSEKVIDLCEINGHKARVIHMKRIRFFRFGICPKALKKDFLSNYDIIISREYCQVMTYLFAKRHPNTSMYSGPYFNMFMLPFFSPFYDAFMTKRLNKLLRCKFVKSELAKEFLEKKGYRDLIDVGVGLDTTVFNGAVMSDPTRELAEYMEQNRCLLFVGRLSAVKNIPFILKLFEKVLEKAPDVKLVLIGRSKETWIRKLLGKKDESFYNELIASVPEHVRNSVKHIERVENSQLQFIYPKAKAFLLPSVTEIFGMVLLEAMYFGAPVVTSLNGGSSTLITDGSLGQVFAEFDADRWCEGVLKYLNDPAYTERVIENGKKRVREEFSWDVIVSQMLKHIEGA